MAAGNSANAEVELKFPGGTLAWYQVSVSVLCDLQAYGLIKAVPSVWYVTMRWGYVLSGKSVWGVKVGFCIPAYLCVGEVVKIHSMEMGGTEGHGISAGPTSDPENFRRYF